MSTTPEQANTIAQFLIANLRDEYKLTRRVLESVPADQLEYAPAGKCMCGGALAAHIAGAEVMFLQTIITSTFSGPPAEAADLKTPEQIVAYYDQIPGLLDQAAALPAEHWSKVIQFYVFNLPAYVLLSFDLKHTIHHRGQLSAYLRPMGGKVPAIYGGSADEPFTATA